MMERDKLESLLIDYIDGTIGDHDRALIAHELQHNAEAGKLYEQLKEVLGAMDTAAGLRPAQDAAQKFSAYVHDALAAENRGKTMALFPAWLYKVAAALLLVLLGGGLGYWISRQQRHEDELLTIKRELELTKQLVMAKLDNELSASQRMLGVKAAYEVEKADGEIVDALIRVMNEDPNSNVRLSAVDALARFRGEEKVRKALIASLLIQTDPVVQMELIRLMIYMKEKDALPPLRRIIEDENTLPAVKDEAYAGIFKI